MLNYIPDDGYTEKAFLKGEPRLYDDFRFEFRPMRIEDKNTIVAAAQQMKPGERDGVLAKAMLPRIVSWDMKDGKGSTVKITHQKIMALKPKLFNRVFWIITGDEATDVDPLETAEERSELDQLRLDAAINGRSFGCERQEVDEKNCVPG